MTLEMKQWRIDAGTPRALDMTGMPQESALQALIVKDPSLRH